MKPIKHVILALLLSITSQLCTASPDLPGNRSYFVVGFAQDDMRNDWQAAQVRELRRTLAGPGIRFRATDAHGSTVNQILDIENLVERGVDLLITGPRDATAMAPVIRRIYQAGTPVMLLSRRTDSEDFTIFISADNHALGRRAGCFLAQHLNGSGRILLLEGVPAASTTLARSAGFREALAGYPDLEIVAVKTVDYQRHLAIRAVETVLQKGIRFDAIFAHNDAIAAGARLALRKAGRDPATIPTVGIDYIREAQTAIRRGEQTASFTYPVFAAEGVEYAMKILRGEAVPQTVTVPSVLVTRDNVETVAPVF